MAFLLDLAPSPDADADLIGQAITLMIAAMNAASEEDWATFDRLEAATPGLHQQLCNLAQAVPGITIEATWRTSDGQRHRGKLDASTAKALANHTPTNVE